MKLFIKILIVALVLGSTAFGGYYFYSFKKPTHEQNTISRGCVPSSQWSDCSLPIDPTYTKKCSVNTPAWIDIINPSENATYKASELILIKWTTCNAQDLQVGIGSQGKDFSVYTTKMSSRAGQYDGQLGWNPKTGSNYFVSIQSTSPNLLVRSKTFTVEP